MRGVFLKIYNKALVLWQNLREIAEDSNNDIALRALLLPVFGVVRIIIRLPFRFLRGVLRYVRGFVRPIIQSPFRFLRGVLRAVRGFVRPIIQAPFRFLGYGLRWARGCMRVFFLFVLPSSFFLSGILSGTAFGTGFPVFDASNVIQSTITAIESVVQTQQQIRQIVQDGENMVKNTTAPAAWLWGTASDSFMDIQRKIDELRHFRDNAGGIDAYLKRYGDVSWYRSSPCFGLNGCSAKEEKTLFSRRGESSAVQKKANETLLRTLDQQGDTISEDARELKNLQRQTQNAAGSLDALGYNSQIEGQQAAQLLQIRSLMIAQQNAEVTRMQAVADREAQEAAAAETLREGDFQASPTRRW